LKDDDDDDDDDHDYDERSYTSKQHKTDNHTYLKRYVKVKI